MAREDVRDGLRLSWVPYRDIVVLDGRRCDLRSVRTERDLINQVVRSRELGSYPGAWSRHIPNTYHAARRARSDTPAIRAEDRAVNMKPVPNFCRTGGIVPQEDLSSRP